MSVYLFSQHLYCIAHSVGRLPSHTVPYSHTCILLPGCDKPAIQSETCISRCTSRAAYAATACGRTASHVSAHAGASQNLFYTSDVSLLSYSKSRSHKIRLSTLAYHLSKLFVLALPTCRAYRPCHSAQTDRSALKIDYAKECPLCLLLYFRGLLIVR